MVAAATVAADILKGDMRFTIGIAFALSLATVEPQLPLGTSGFTRAAQALPGAAPAQRPRSVWDGVYTISQAKRGSTHTERCSSCHGFDLEGDTAPTLIGPAFTGIWNGRTLGDLFERIEANFKASGGDQGADDPELLRQQAADFLAFVLLENQFPSGPGELPAALETLRQIGFLSSRP